MSPGTCVLQADGAGDRGYLEAMKNSVLETFRLWSSALLLWGKELSLVSHRPQFSTSATLARTLHLQHPEPCATERPFASCLAPP